MLFLEDFPKLKKRYPKLKKIDEMFENESYQKTLAKPAIVKGKGLHTGKDVTLTIKPAPEDTGIVFLRIDLKPSVEICLLYTSPSPRDS